MKLAEALSIRKDLQMRIQHLEMRIKNNVKVQEDDEPLEDPHELMKELHSCLVQLEELIGRINLTNIKTKNEDGLSITQLMAKKDTLTLRIGILRNIYNEASNILNRYSPTEIRQECVIDVKQLSKQIDDCSSRLRKLDMEIQGLNFMTELV
ncbi:MAG: DIP1984 family protein [Prevotella sp.]|nr:DIP1984 family protein [Prevotella sp.]